MTKTLAELTAEIREVNIEKGWRPADGGPGSNTWGDYVALLHSEVSEALEAYRDHRLADATDHVGQYSADTPKPEGVGSELADCVIRLLDMSNVFRLRLMFPAVTKIRTVADVPSADVSDQFRVINKPADSFGDWNRYLHGAVYHFGCDGDPGSVLSVIVAFASHCGLDLAAEVERKIAYNRTRAFQHGGRTLAN